MRSRQALVVWLAAGLAVIGVAKATQAALQPLPSERVVTLGESVRGRKIEAVRVGDPSSPNKALVVGVIHGDEPAGLQITAALKDSFDGLTGVDLWIVDAFNPDGLAAHKRVNAHGVDLNRNFPGPRRGPAKPGSGFNPGPSAFSEPETREIRDLVAELQPRISIWYHQPWDAVLRDPCHGPNPVQRRYAGLAHMRTSCRGSDLHGTAIGWEKRTNPASTAMVVELPHGKLSAAAAMRQARAVVEVTASASS
jgi:protein MpaA